MVVRDLLQWRAPAILILAVLLVQWNTALKKDIDRDFLELFSGKAEVSKALREIHLNGAAIDVDYHAQAFDLAGNAGFALALAEVLRCKPGGLLVVALDCRSFSKMCRHTHGRDWLQPYGNSGYNFVALGNILGTRVALLLILAACRGLIFLLEQPDGSALPDLPPMQYVWGAVKVFTTRFYMGLCNGPTPKPHRVWSNAERIVNGLAARAGYMPRALQNLCTTRTVRKYVDKSGINRCVGIRDALKNSQHYTRDFGVWLAQASVDAKMDPLPAPRQDMPSLDHGASDYELFTEQCLPELLAEGPNLWKEAELWPVITYLARCKYTVAPGRWVEVLKKLDLA